MVVLVAQIYGTTDGWACSGGTWQNIITGFAADKVAGTIPLPHILGLSTGRHYLATGTKGKAPGLLRLKT